MPEKNGRPLKRGMSDGVGAEGQRLLESEEAQGKEEERSRQRMQRLCRIALPHICLYVLLCLYLFAGAWAFACIEHNAERTQQAKKLERIAELYEQIAAEAADACGVLPDERLRAGVYASLSRISQFFEGVQFRLMPPPAAAVDGAKTSPEGPQLLDEVLPPRWSPMSSILYALSILTTTGYGPTTPLTPLGQWLSIGYGLLGIPLTVLAAVDIGRFLSDVVLTSYDKILRTAKRVSVLCGVRRRTGKVILQVETKALQSLNRLQQKKPMIVLANSKKGRRRNGEGDGAGGEGKEDKTEPIGKRRLPLSVNAAILLLFCMLGGVVYMAAAGSDHNFIEGFFVTFNLVANLTMSEMPTDVSRLMTLIYIFVFVTFGLAVLSMCADLAASELKWVFLKIHYFGRKINWAKRRSAKKQQQQQQIEFEIQQLLKLIDHIRAKYPDKSEISSLDILRYVQELNGQMSNGPYGEWPYRSFNMWLIQHHRRNTMAFMPQSIDALKFADEMDQEEEQLISSTVNALLVNWRRQLRSGEQNTFIPLLPFGV
uniref:Potassium channel domain-containing protein n=1 Tax=Globodera rostochiensis TaxID=31243 RepID=A0A914I995_GLORO